MRLNGFGWLVVTTTLVTSLVIAGCGSIGQPKPSVEFKVAVPVKTVKANNFAWGEDRPPCDPFFHQVCTTNPETGEETCACVPD